VYQHYKSPAQQQPGPTRQQQQPSRESPQPPLPLGARAAWALPHRQPGKMVGPRIADILPTAGPRDQVRISYHKHKDSLAELLPTMEELESSSAAVVSPSSLNPTRDSLAHKVVQRSDSG
jgi:hypothetical protein